MGNEKKNQQSGEGYYYAHKGNDTNIDTYFIVIHRGRIKETFKVILIM